MLVSRKADPTVIGRDPKRSFRDGSVVMRKLTGKEFFERFIEHDTNVTQLGALDGALPDDPRELREIQGHCLRAVSDGIRTLPRNERWRLDRLARELGILSRRRARLR
jgi:hypothetical protein